MIGGEADPAGHLSTPFDDLMGGRVLEASAERVVYELPITPQLHQPYGLVHGGVYASIAETAASFGAARAAPSGAVVGVSNATDFLSAVREGVLTATASPLSVGPTLQLWRVETTDADGQLVAHSTVKLYNLPRRAP